MEPALDFTKNRYCSNHSLLFSWYFCSKKNIEGQRTLSKYCGWHIDTANGFAADGRRFLSIAYFSRRRAFGIFLWDAFHLKVVQSWLGCIIAASVISFPLMYKNARAAFELIDENLVYAGRTLGMSDFSIFWKIIMPTAGPGIASGTILTFARALGEYGATSMLAGNIPGKTATISQRIAMVIQDQDYMTAGIWVTIVLLIALIAMVLMNVISSKKSTRKVRW